jgi:hypothetical protein
VAGGGGNTGICTSSPYFGVKLKIKINRNIPINAVILAIVLLSFVAEGESSAILRGVGIATGCGLVERGSIPQYRQGIFFSPQRPDRLWVLPTLLSRGYWDLFLRG